MPSPFTLRCSMIADALTATQRNSTWTYARHASHPQTRSDLPVNLQLTASWPTRSPCCCKRGRTLNRTAAFVTKVRPTSIARKPESIERLGCWIFSHPTQNDRSAYASDQFQVSRSEELISRSFTLGTSRENSNVRSRGTGCNYMAHSLVDHM